MIAETDQSSAVLSRRKSERLRDCLVLLAEKIGLHTIYQRTNSVAKQMKTVAIETTIFLK
ncbi:hypothetical protein C3E98_018040 [Pseudomonas sp. MWU13-2625]|nr:hypothetical protein C3E98_018040 [Pseudomonas sp. MWU13-2625]